MPSYTVRTMQLSDSEEVQQIWLSVKFDIFNYGHNMLLVVDPEGSFVAQDITTGKLLGACCCANLSPELSFVYNYAVRPECQGLGIGTAIWNRVMAHMGNRNAGLYGIDQKMINFYKNRHNFNVIPKRLRIFLKGKPVVKSLTDSIPGICLVDMNDKNIADVIEYDKQVCDGLDRSAQLRALNGQFKSTGVAVINDSNQVMGYCFISVTVSGNLIVAPLYANNQQIAELLVGNCLQRIPDYEPKTLCYSHWNSNDHAAKLANKLGLKQYHEMPIMFTKKALDGQLHRIYGIGLSPVLPY